MFTRPTLLRLPSAAGQQPKVMVDTIRAAGTAGQDSSIPDHEPGREELWLPRP